MSLPGVACTPATDHHEQRTLGRQALEPRYLRKNTRALWARVGGSEHIASLASIGAASDPGPRVLVAHAILTEPGHDFIDRVPSLVRVVVLVLDPDFRLAAITNAISYHV